MTCHNCGIEAKRFGFTKQGLQRHRCKQCGKTFSEVPERPLDNLRVPLDKASQVIGLLCEGVGVRATERLTRLNRRTVLNVLELAGQKCTALLNAKLVNLRVSEVQIDELYSFVYSLPKNTAPSDILRGDQFVFLAIERNSKLILNWLVGKRTKPNVCQFLRSLKSRLDSNPFQVTTDCFNAYFGRHGGITQVFGQGVNYGTEYKKFGHPLENVETHRYEAPMCLAIKREARIGNPNLARTTINHLERQNLNVRLFNRRFTRKTLGYSKKFWNHQYSVALQVAYHNFCRVSHAHGQTPAQAHGISDHVWTAEELIAATP